MVFKGSSFYIHLQVWDTFLNVGKDGDLSNITLRLVKDGGVSTTLTNSPEEVDTVNTPGLIRVLLTDDEANANVITVGGKSSTADVVVFHRTVILSTIGQGIYYPFLVWDSGSNIGKTGDALNLTLRIAKDNTVSAPTNTVTEIDSTNLPGLYRLLLTSDETTADSISISGESSTANIVIPTSTIEFRDVVVPAVTIDSILSANKTIGEQVTITGSNFGNTQGAVIFGNVCSPILSWSDTSIILTIPFGASISSNTVYVLSEDARSAFSSYTVASPTVIPEDSFRRDTFKTIYDLFANDGDFSSFNLVSGYPKSFEDADYPLMIFERLTPGEKGKTFQGSGDGARDASMRIIIMDKSTADLDPNTDLVEKKLKNSMGLLAQKGLGNFQFGEGSVEIELVGGKRIHGNIIPISFQR